MILKVSEKTGAAFVGVWCDHILRGEAIPEAEKVKLLVENRNGTYTTVDNTTGQCYIEDFKKEHDAIGWVMGEFDL